MVTGLRRGGDSIATHGTLVISVKTVDRHRANILQKLGTRDRLGLTTFAIRAGAGIVEP